MSTYLVFLPFLISLIATIIIQKLFLRKGLVDKINSRSLHKVIATRSGGISIYLSIFFIILFLYLNQNEIFDFSILIPLSVIFFIGLYDDLYNADFKLKFFIQIIVAKILIDQGFAITNFYGFLGLYEVPWVFAQLTTIFVYLILVNSINFIDGIDGLALTEVIKILFFIEFVSDSPSDITPLIYIVVLSLLPLYYFNLKKENKVFLGDGGSLLLASIVSISIFDFLNEEHLVSLKYNLNKTIFSVLICIYPLIDLLRVILIRLFNGKSPFHPDKNHIHHKIFELTGSSLKTILSIQIISVTLIVIYSFVL